MSSIIPFTVLTPPADSEPDDAEWIEQCKATFIVLEFEGGDCNISIERPTSPEGPPTIVVDSTTWDIIVRVEEHPELHEPD